MLPSAPTQCGGLTAGGAAEVRRARMARWQPDPTFYPTARAAMAGPPEELAYVVTLNTAGDGRPDAMCVLDIAPGSATHGQIVGRVDMPQAGDELHHFGWSACSSALCPNAPHPHVERRHLVVL